ncbi:hypothetical protein AB0O52_20465 [Arthrobacter sp. NPDC080073]|uniref:hypothetical protein n=1 Tax=Arthrobacter sp. NPDC080073 TaxID=3155919 RepID=UPI003427EBDE
MAPIPSTRIDWSGTGLRGTALEDLQREAEDYAERLATMIDRDAYRSEWDGAIHKWAHAKTRTIYPSPAQRRTPPEPSAAWVHATFFLGYFVFLLLLASVKPLRDAGSGVFLILAGFIVLWVVVAKSVSSSNKAMVERWWEEYDPHRFERGRLYAVLCQTVNARFEIAHAEYHRPVSSIPAPDVDTYPRERVKWTPRSARPEPMASCTDRQAEFLAKQWMEFLGESGCVVSAATRDGGADVVSLNFMAEVKHHASVIPPAMVRAVVGVAHVEGKVPLFFARTGYTDASVEFADRAGAALFAYDFARGTLAAKSKMARRALSEGLPAIAPDLL